MNMETINLGSTNLALAIPYKQYGEAICAIQESANQLIEQGASDESVDLAMAECELSIAGMYLEKGLRRPEQRDRFEVCLNEYRDQLKAKLLLEVDSIERDHQEDYIRQEIMTSAFRILDEEMTIRRMASQYERTKAYIAETRTRRAMGSIAVGTGVGAGMYWGIDTFGGAAATGGVLTFLATKGQMVARVTKSVVVSATRTASKQVSHQGAQISQGIISEHVPGEYNSISMPSGVAGTLEEIENKISIQLIHPDKSSRMESAVDAATGVIDTKYCPPPLKEMLSSRGSSSD